jgi:hypothetical protein
MGVPAGWHNPESTFMPSPEDSDLGQRWETANSNIPIQRCDTVGFLRVHAEEDVNKQLWPNTIPMVALDLLLRLKTQES